MLNWMIVPLVEVMIALHLSGREHPVVGITTSKHLGGYAENGLHTIQDYLSI